MDYQEMLDRIQMLEEEILSLPAGTIVHKNIRGKRHPYLQWAENGKTKSKYLRESEVESIGIQVSRRHQLMDELKDLKGRMQYPRLYQNHRPTSAPVLYETGGVVYSSFRTNVLMGDALSRQIQRVQSYQRRDCYRQLDRFMKEDMNGRVCLLYGLRRTGKTTMLFQAMGDLSAEERTRCAYIKVRTTETMADLDADLKALWDRGVRYVFLDEITLLHDFIDGASLFSDVYAMMGMKIVLSGTDSLGFWFTQTQELYDRAFTIHTTFIPFREYSRLLGIHDIDEYIRYGGTLLAGELAFDDPDALSFDAAFRDDESTRRYIDTAICHNIQHSLAYCRDGHYFRHLQMLYEAGELTSAIQRIIESMNHQFVLSVLTRPFKSHDLGSAAELLRKQGDIAHRNLILDKINREKITKKLMELLQIRNQEDEKVGIIQAHVDEIRTYLKALDLITETSTRDLQGHQTEYILFAQPGMRYCQAQALVHVLMNDEEFLSFSPIERELACEKILEEVRGRMLEDIVLMETTRALSREKEIFRLSGGRNEFDMVIRTRGKPGCEAYEIKHSDQMVPRQYHALEDKTFCAQTEELYGSIQKKCVIYRGANERLESGIEYRNVEDYLRGLGAFQIFQG